LSSPVVFAAVPTPAACQRHCAGLIVGAGEGEDPSGFPGFSISTLPEAASAPLSKTRIDLSALLMTALGEVGAASWPSEYSAVLIAASTALNSRAAYSPSTMPGWVTSSG
jgi:hypothetical protein